MKNIAWMPCSRFPGHLFAARKKWRARGISRGVLAGVAGLAWGFCPMLKANPTNDNFVNAISISNFPAVVTGSNVNATKERGKGEPDHAGNAGGKSVWWNWAATNAGPVMITTAGSSFDTLLGVYTNDTLATLVEVASDNDSGCNGSSLVTFQATNNIVYHIAVDGYSYTPSGQSNSVVFSGSIVLTLTNAPLNDPPAVSLTKVGYNSIYIAPTNVTLTATAAASGTNTIASVQFWESTNCLGSVFANPYSLIWSNVPPGLYSLTAVAIDSSAISNTSLPMNLTVTRPPFLNALKLDHTTGAHVGLSGFGQSYSMESSSNLVDWMPLGTLTGVCAQTTFTDSTATVTDRRFYRVKTRSFETNWISGWLHASNTCILDAANQPVFFHGINSSGMEWGSGGGYTAPLADEYDKLAQWGFNLVRLPVAWANIETNAPTITTNGVAIHTYNEEYLIEVDQIIAQCGQRGIPVILSMHQWGWSPAFKLHKTGGDLVRGCGFPPWLYDTNYDTAWTARSNFFGRADSTQDWYIAVWTNLAARYATNPVVVGADLCNEPSTIADYSSGPAPCKFPVDDLYKRLGAAVLSNNPHLLLVMQDGLSTKLITMPPFTNQMVFSYHNYPANWPYDGLVWATTNYNRAQTWNVPIWQGEFETIGPLTVTTGPTAWQTQTAQMLQWCKDHNVNWCYWAYQRAFRPLDGDGGTGPIDWDTLRVLQAGF